MNAHRLEPRERLRRGGVLGFVVTNPALCLVLLLLGLGGPIAFAAATPVFATADETAHVDYAYQVWQGRLPVFEDGIISPIEAGAVPPVQWASQHPPLFYLLLAPVVGPLLETGHPTMAGMAARGIVVLLALLAVATSSWAAAAVAPRVPLLRVVFPVVLGTAVWFMRLGGVAYNDTLVILCVLLTLGTAASVVRSGLTPGRLVGLSVAASAASLTRLSAVPVVLACLSAVVVALLLRKDGRRGDWVLAGIVPGVAVIATSGWFYARNVSLTGSVTGGHPEWSEQHLSRVVRPVTEVLFDLAFWETMGRQFSFSSDLAGVGAVVLFVVPFVVGTVVAAARCRTSADMVLLLAGIGSIVGVALMQAVYTAGGGGVNGRYLAPVLPHLALLVSLGIVAARRLVLTLAAAWLALRTVDLALDLSADVSRSRPENLVAVHPGLAWSGFGLLLSGALGALVLLVSRPGVLSCDDPGRLRVDGSSAT